MASLFKIINVSANFLILSDTLLLEYFSLWRKHYGIVFSQLIQQHDFTMTSNYVILIVSIKLCLDVENK